MSSDNPYAGNPFHQLRPQHAAAMREEAILAYEHGRVNYTLGRVGLGDLKRHLLRESRRNLETGRFTFLQFNEHFRNFPVYLGCSNLSETVLAPREERDAKEPELRPVEEDRPQKKKREKKKPRGPHQLELRQDAILPKWFMEFSHLPFYDVYLAMHERVAEKADGRPVGLIFPRKGIRQGLIIHNGDMDTYVPEKTSCHLYRGGGRHPIVLVVQPYAGFLDHIYKNGHGWVPEDGSF
jgi:hypothetical protein